MSLALIVCGSPRRAGSASKGAYGAFWGLSTVAVEPHPVQEVRTGGSIRWR